ncbi:uncharacterized protein Gasu_43420 [Galdieria sulphuraria]|uniref:ABM domain-containing protein n=1 Tax=Galdieria sulphuraria TaxID=130081 RepID=M2VXZ8_GALSU|nr:uncharacterized protein Gasu_43420 [Galdieria sulphuraria]EME28176.1 hypothetical protein Gasu_43420 [Galdieria sulphuraria]|eukprot:XP_005704696.1 hypothetical protein Gasu_43420 [Galdieria sulphuraria]
MFLYHNHLFSSLICQPKCCAAYHFNYNRNYYRCIPQKSNTYQRKLNWRMATSHDNLEKTQNFLGNLFSQFSKLGDELLGKRKSTRGKEVEPLHEGYLTSLDFEEQEEDRWILCSRIVCNSESLRSARQIIQKFVQESRSNDCPKRLLSISCHEDPDVPGVFMLIEVFQTQLAMVEYQKENLYQSFLRQLQPLMKEPLGVHLSKERNGKILSSLYPYGPGGEGGRDDMVYR